MKLPERLAYLESAEDKRILGEFYDRFSGQQWFERAELNGDNRTLEVYVIGELSSMDKVTAFCFNYGLKLDVANV